VTAWIVRAGRSGEREAWAIANGVAGAGWREVPNMAAADTKDKVRAMVDAAFPTAPAGRRANYTGQLCQVGTMKKYEGGVEV
jgi:restriction system protein